MAEGGEVARVAESPGQTARAAVPLQADSKNSRRFFLFNSIGYSPLFNDIDWIPGFFVFTHDHTPGSGKLSKKELAAKRNRTQAGRTGAGQT